MIRYRNMATLILRLAIAFNFLSAVSSRLGGWGGEGNWDKFLVYTAEVNSFAPAIMIPFLAVLATILEIMLSVLLLAGFRTKWAAFGSGMLMLLFALAMSYSFGVKSAFDYSVFVDSASAFLLASMPADNCSLDHYLIKFKKIKPLYETENGNKKS